MNREQKAAAVAEIADAIRESEAVYAVDFRGISVPQAAGLRTELRAADATFRVVKNSLTERAADAADAAVLKPLLEGPTALTFVRGDAAVAAKALAIFGRQTDLLAFKGGMLGGDALDSDQMRALSQLPARDVLYGQLVGVVASPITGVVRGLHALIQGIALQLGQIAEKKASGELAAGEAPAAAATEAPAETGTDTPADDAEAAAEVAVEAAVEAEEAADEATEAAAEAVADTTTDTDDNEADASAQADDAEATQED
ncbi:MAG: 50S ribosomal protein L10 [Actinomycetota bacterium]|nr:50S ribosomal protein L10 [Actinomycetota bacterium]